MDTLRVLNPDGIRAFRSYLHRLRGEPAAVLPAELLVGPEFSNEFPGGIKLEKRPFATLLEMMRYLGEVLSPLDHTELFGHVGVWSWLSLFYFDLVCPEFEGKRYPGRDYRHILDLNYRYRHRHLLSGPYRIFHAYGDDARLFLSAPVHIESQFLHELASRQNLITNRGVIESATALYFDEAGGKPKRGAQSKSLPGNLYRFVQVIQQLDVTYDLYSLNGREIIELLPLEFRQWHPGALINLR